MRRFIVAAALVSGAVFVPEALSFCGFYVAQADTKLYNQSSKVVLARKGDETTLTMANDFQGDVKAFALVIPVPTVLTKDQIRVANGATIDRIDAYSAPRLVEYWDEDPCSPPMPQYDDEMILYSKRSAMAPRELAAAKPDALGVTIEARYDVGEYDILLLSAAQSTGLEIWLKQNGYQIPAGAGPVLQSYIRQNMKFFVAKVDLDEHAKLETPYLRPLQVTYTSPKFMLPIRLGTANAKGTQELFVFALTPRGRIETTNYRTTKVPTDVELPALIQKDFRKFYKDLFSTQVTRQGMQTVFLEYAWPLSVSCDPCSADQLSAAELQQLGAGWASDYHGGVDGGFITRLHVRYDLAHFPEDLVFQETADQQTFQGRYVVRHTFDGDTQCPAGKAYEKELVTRQSAEATTLASLAGWDLATIRASTPKRANAPKPTSWWETLE